MPTDELTLGEVARRFEDRFAGVREDLQNLCALIHERVSLERHQLELEAISRENVRLAERMTSMEENAKDRDRQHRADRRLLFSALIVPTLMVLLTVYLQTR